MVTAYDVARDQAIATGLPTAVIAIVDHDEPELWQCSVIGPPDWLELCRADPALTAIVACLHARGSALEAGYELAT